MDEKEYSIAFYLMNGHRIITKESGRSEEGGYHIYIACV